MLLRLRRVSSVAFLLTTSNNSSISVKSYSAHSIARNRKRILLRVPIPFSKTRLADTTGAKQRIYSAFRMSTSHKHDDNKNSIMTTIDGSQGEGGGQILRNSMTYASILERPIRITNIRANRTKPGLQAQHVAAIKLAADIGVGNLEGAEMGSVEVTYKPHAAKSVGDSDSGSGTETNTQQGQQQPQVFEGRIKTAGSICLLLQAALPCALLIHGKQSSTTTTIKLILTGGTNASMAPQYDYWERVFLPTLQRFFGWKSSSIINPKVLMRGYFPKGGGRVEVDVPVFPKRKEQSLLPFPPIQLTERGDVEHIQIRSFHAGKLPKHLAVKMSKAAKTYLHEHLQSLMDHITVEEEIVTEEKAVGSGLGILLVARTSTGCLLGGSSLCSPKQKADQAGIMAAKELVDTLQDGGCVDEWMQDQLILYMALAGGTSTVLTGSLTLHTQTAILVAKQLVPGVMFDVQTLGEEEIHSSSSASSGSKKQKLSSSVQSAYGKDGRVSGKHLITCKGVGYVPEGY